MMVGRLVDWLRQWSMTEAKYLDALKAYRTIVKQNDEMRKELEGHTNHWSIELKNEMDKTEEATAALHCERLRFIDELAAKDTEMLDLDRVCKERKVEKDLAERANEGLVKVNDLLHSQMEMSMGRNGAEKVHYLNEQNKNHPLQGIL